MYDMKALYEAASVENAVALRLEHPEAQIIAGGSDDIGWKGRQVQRFRHLGNGVEMADEDDLNHHFFNGTGHGFER